MGKRGPRPRPRLLSIDRTPKPDGSVQPPPEVAGCPHALEVWQRTVAAMQGMGTWSAADSATVARYAILHEMHRRYAVECLAGADVMETSTGYRSPTPAATMLLKLSGTLLATEKALGLPAAARRQIGAPAPAEPDALDRFLAEG